MKRPTGEIKQLAAPPAAAAPSRHTLRLTQNACYEALSLALKEGHVFAALTGPEGSGKSTVLEAVLSDRTDRALRCIRITDPDKVPASLADQIEAVAYAEAGKPENLERHVVLAIDDAHTSSHELLLCLSRLAAMREPGRRVPQILLVGRPELWDRLAADHYEVLARRLAIRAALPAAEDDADPWASIEDEVTQTMNQLRADSENLPALHENASAYGHDAVFDREYGFGSGHGEPSGGALPGAEHPEVPPPSMFALFPDPPPKASRSAARDTRRRLVMPLVSLFVGVAAFAFALSFYDWPDLIGDMPWSDPKPTEPFVMPNLPQVQSFGLPIPPAPKPPASTLPPKPVATLPAPAPAPSPAAATPNPVRVAPVARPQPTAQPSVAQLPAAPPPPARQIAVAAPPERPVIPAVPAEKPVAPAPAATAPVASAPVAPAPVAPVPVIAEAPTRPEPTPPPVAALPTPVAPIAAPISPPAPAPVVASLAPPARAPAVAEATLSPVVMALLLRRGDEESAIGDISAARLLYERAAESGSGLAARQLGRTYDPAFLPPAIATALADVGKAKQWYQRAAALGNADAATRLKVLNQGR